MSIAESYPVFAPDQVLTNNHLNELTDFLEQQERLSRCKLVGSGIVCGLEMTYTPGLIQISQGCALTSQGYMILLCETKCEYFVPYTSPKFPEHLNLISQCPEKPGSNPFYESDRFRPIFKRIEKVEFEKLSDDEQKQGIKIANIAPDELDKYAVVLFLEAEELSLKNCDTNDCNNKGSRMDFDVQVLLVRKNVLKPPRDNVEIVVGQKIAKHVDLKRYNVPVSNLKSATEVLDAFADITDDQTLDQLAGVYNYCYNYYKDLLKDEADNPFKNLLDKLKKVRQDILTQQPILIQYFYDFVDDLIKAYYEFKYKAFEVFSECCLDEMAFPFHITLGEANKSTALGLSKFRQYFIYSPLFNDQGNRLAEIRFLFKRMKLLVEEIAFETLTGFEDKRIKITPSRYGHVYLSERCIPYYYKVAEKDKELFKNWNYEKTKRGNERYNLGYNSPEYNQLPVVSDPLKFDIEGSNFFRIEGHIGKPVLNALTTVKGIQQDANLPFDIVALSADYIGALVRGEEPECVIQDLESDYRVIVAEFVCKLHDAFCNVSRIRYTPFRSFVSDAVLTAPVLMARTIGPSEAAPMATNLIDDDIKILTNTVENVALRHPVVSVIIDEFQTLKTYRKGDTLVKLCGITKGTIGAGYKEIMDKGEFINPVSVNPSISGALLYHQLFELIDSFESLFQLLMTNELADLDMATFQKLYERYEANIRNNYTSLSKATDNVQMLLHTCLSEKLDALKNEYLRRTAQFRLAKNFMNYFKNHGGIEHKAGVPKGGTFILVYHEERRDRFVDPRAVFVNRELGSLLLTNIRELVKPTAELNDLEFNTKILQGATLYKEPELFFRLKDTLQQYLDDCKDITPERKIKIKEIIDAQPAKPTRFQIKDGMVIADFYIPYLCCSNCPPIAYILPAPPKEEVENPMLKMEHGVICNGSDDKYLLETTPKEGVFTVDDKVNDHIEKGELGYFFAPRGLAAGKHVIKFVAGGKSAPPLTVDVVETPKAAFVFKPETARPGDKIKFENKSTGTNNQSKFKWTINGKLESDDKKDFEYTVKSNDEKLVVVLTASNDVCSNSTEEKEIIIDRQVEKRRIIVCKSKVRTLKLEPNLTTRDRVADVKNEDKIPLDEAKLVISPIKASNEVTQDFHVSYSLNGKPIEVTVTVHIPEAGFFVTMVGNETIEVTLESKDRNHTENSWDINPKGDSEGHSVAEPFRFLVKRTEIKRATALTLTHNVVDKLESGECPGQAKMVIPNAMIEKALNLRKFDNNTKFE